MRVKILGGPYAHETGTVKKEGASFVDIDLDNGTSISLHRAQVSALAAEKVIDVSPLDTREDQANAGALLRVLATIRGELEERRKEEKAPHLAECRAIDARYKSTRDEIDRVCTLVRKRLADVAREEREKKLAAEAEAKKALKSGDSEALAAALENVHEEPPAAEGVSTRWKWTIASYDASKVPSHYLKLDERRVKEFIALEVAAGREPVISGVTLEKEPVIVAKKVKS